MYKRGSPQKKKSSIKFRIRTVDCLRQFGVRVYALQL